MEEIMGFMISGIKVLSGQITPIKILNAKTVP